GYLPAATEGRSTERDVSARRRRRGPVRGAGGSDRRAMDGPERTMGIKPIPNGPSGPSFVGGADDLGEADAECVVDDDDLATGDERAVDEQVDRASGDPVELDDRTRRQREQVTDSHAGAAEFGGDTHLDVGQQLQGFGVGQREPAPALR